MKKIIVLLALVTGQFVISQDSKNVADNQFKINFFTPGVEFETGVSTNSTINLALGTGIFLRERNNQGTEFGVFPFFEGQYRYYQSGKSIIGNIDFTEDYAGFVGPIWGMQRTYNSGFNLNLSAGVGYSWSDSFEGEITPILSFTLGWVLGGRK